LRFRGKTAPATSLPPLKVIQSRYDFDCGQPRTPKVQTMLWNLVKPGPEDPGEKARREHSAWLTKALAGTRRYPEIPVRPVPEGGFDELRHRPNGMKLAERWWRMALRRVDIP
jgi:hypothetical protein